MAKVEQHDLREYHICTGALATSPGATIAHIPIPASGQVVRCVAACDTAGDADQAITFELATAALLSGGATATMTLLNADVVGDIQKIEFDPLSKVNMAREAEDADAIDTSTPACLEIISAGGGAAGAYIFIVTISP